MCQYCSGQSGQSKSNILPATLYIFPKDTSFLACPIIRCTWTRKMRSVFQAVSYVHTESWHSTGSMVGTVWLPRFYEPRHPQVLMTGVVSRDQIFSHYHRLCVHFGRLVNDRWHTNKSTYRTDLDTYGYLHVFTIDYAMCEIMGLQSDHLGFRTRSLQR